MLPDSFQYFLNAVGPAITKKDTKFREAIWYMETVNSRCLFRIKLTDQLYQA